MDLQVTPSQRHYEDAHRKRLDRLWPAQTPKAKIKKAVVVIPPEPVMTAQEWFASVWDALDGPLCRHSIRSVQDIVCEHFAVPLLYMESSRRNHVYYLPRAAAIYLAHRFTSRPATVIGREFGNRDHTTILYCIASVKKMIALDHPIAKDIEILSAKLQGANHD